MRRDLVRKIQAGILPPGGRLANARSLAASYGISQATVQATLAKLVESGHLVRQNGIGTFVAQREFWQAIDMVGYMVHATYNPYHLSMLAAISRQAKAIGANLLVGEGEKAEEFIRELKAARCRYLIRPPFWASRERQIWQQLQQQQINTVIINDFWLNGGPLNCVNSDNEAGVARMVEHLIGLGHRYIMLLDENGAMSPQIITAFIRTMEYNGLAVTRPLLRTDLENNIFFSPELLQDIYDTCTAVLVTHDYYALQLAGAFTKANYQIGRDISIAGIDATTEIISSIEHPVDAIAREAFKLLAAGEKNRKITIPPLCHFRETTAPPTREIQPQQAIYGGGRFHAELPARSSIQR